MTENDRDQQNEEPEQQCCPTGSSPDSCSAPKETPAACCSPSTKSPLKTAIFIAIMLAAICVAVISIANKSNRRDTAQPPTAERPVILTNGLETITELSDLAKIDEVIFVLLPGQAGPPAQSAAARVSAAVGMLLEREKTAAEFTLEPTAEKHDQVTAGFGIDKFPAVIIVARGCKPAKLDGEISQENLVAAYVKAAAKASGCGPGGCDIKSDCE